MIQKGKIFNGLKSRKFCVWLISLGVVLVLYLIYGRISKIPTINIDTPAEFADTAFDSNASQFDGEIGKIGDVGVANLEKPVFRHRDKNGKIDREFGFETLLRAVRDEWETEKPFMNIFRHNLKCYLTADKGYVQTETVVGSTSPKDATLTGNVVIRILSEGAGDIKESFIYLDDVIFISEKSQFSTDGPVKFVSEDALMLGRGLEIVYNDELDRLEFLRIIHLDSLHLKTSSNVSLFSSNQTDVDRGAGTGSRIETQRSAEPVAADAPQKAKSSPITAKRVTEQKEGEKYRCVFSKNVVIECPEQLIFADEVSINNILWSKASSSKSDKADTGSTDETQAADVPVTSKDEPNESPQEYVDIPAPIEHSSVDAAPNDAPTPNWCWITCNNGILVTPMDSPGAPERFTELGPEITVTADKSTKNFDDTGSRTTLVTQKIDYFVPTGDTVAGGSSELTFYVDVNDLMGAEVNQAVPVKVTARKEAKFLAALNQVVFEGDSLCTMVQQDTDSQRKYTLSAPKLTVHLSSDKPEQSSESAIVIKHLTAGGGVANLAVVKTAGENLLGGIELKCSRFDYDPGRRVFLATGPGVIKVDNSKISEPKKKKKKKLGRFSLQRPCWAIVEDFDTLKYSLESNRVIADAQSQRIHIGYVPIIKGQYGQVVKATAGHIEALLYETADGRIELSTLSAAGGVTYEEEAKKTKWGKGKAVQFVGSEFFLDAKKSMLTAWGDEFQPCLLNGAAVDGIEYNSRTGRVKTKIIAPGQLQMGR